MSLLWDLKQCTTGLCKSFVINKEVFTIGIHVKKTKLNIFSVNIMFGEDSINVYYVMIFKKYSVDVPV